MNNPPKITQLSNGLTCVLVPVEGLQSVTVLGLVKAGTRYETRVNNGISHFLEHMVFKGTQKYKTAMDISATVDQVGGVLNAFTDKEYTGYYVKSSVESADVAFEVVSQLMFHPTIPEAELEIERGVILEEIRMYEDQPQNKVIREFFNLMFFKSTLGWDTLGKSDIVRKLKRDDFMDYYSYLYTPNRMVLAVAGGINHIHDLDTKIANSFGSVHQRTEFDPVTYTYEQTKPIVRQISKDTEQCHLVYGFRSFGKGNKDRYVLSVLNAVLGGGMSSRLFTEIREKRGLAYYVGSMADAFTETGYFIMRAGTKPESASEVVKLAQAEFDKLKQKSISDKELDKGKEYLKGHLLLGLEDSSEVASFYGEDMLLEGKTRSISQVITGIDAVTSEDVKRLAIQLFEPKAENLAAIGPDKWVSKLAL